VDGSVGAGGDSVAVLSPCSKPPGPHRDEEYKAFIREQPSVVSGASPCDPAHSRWPGMPAILKGGMGQKASDYLCLPLTRIEHTEQHDRGHEEYARRHSIDYREQVILHLIRYIERLSA